ncbi:MAG: murein biosynthesis integral membrane protein MurJ [Candidatus Saccharimonadales bacterium]
MNSTKSIDSKVSRVSISNVAALLMASALGSQILGFLRTKLVNANFPIAGPHSTDAYFAAFNVPDFFYFTLSAGALGVALIPVLTDRYSKNGSKAVWELSNSLMNLLAIVMFVIGLFILVFAHWLIHHVVAPGLSPVEANTAANIMRFLAFDPFIFTVSGILASVQQTFGKFFFYAIAPLTYNVSIIISIFVFKDNIGLVGLGLGALVGALIQLAIIGLGAKNSNFRWTPKILWKSRDFRTVLRNLPPRSLDQGMDQVEDIIETHLASGLGSGSITNFNNAYVLSTAPILLLGTAISTAAFPRLNHRLSQGRPDLFRKDFLKIIRAMIWLSAPIVVIGYYCRGYLARLIYTQGNAQIALIFGFMIGAIFFGILYAIVSRWFYAHKDTKTPLLVSIFTIGLNIVLAYTLSRPSAYGVAGLALAQSIVAAVEVIILSVIMVKRDRKLFDWTFIAGLIRIASVTGFSIVAGFIMISIYPLEISYRGFFVLGSRVMIIAVVTLAVHFGVSTIFDLEEVRPVYKRLRKLISRPVNWQV